MQLSHRASSTQTSHTTSHTLQWPKCSLVLTAFKGKYRLNVPMTWLPPITLPSPSFLATAAPGHLHWLSLSMLPQDGHCYIPFLSCQAFPRSQCRARPSPGTTENAKASYPHLSLLLISFLLDTEQSVYVAYWTGQ